MYLKEAKKLLKDLEEDLEYRRFVLTNGPLVKISKELEEYNNLIDKKKKLSDTIFKTEDNITLEGNPIGNIRSTIGFLKEKIAVLMDLVSRQGLSDSQRSSLIAQIDNYRLNLKTLSEGLERVVEETELLGE